jgi:hypothetical protein
LKGDQRKTVLEGPGGARQGFIGSGGGELDGSGMPGRIFYLAWFQRQEQNIRDSFRYEGSETIAKRKCLKVSFDIVPGVPADKRPTMSFWIDLERGGHPLQVEVRQGGELRTRVADIELAEVGPPNARLWIPMKGRATTHVFIERGTEPARVRYAHEPLVIEEIAVRAPSVKLNAGLEPSELEVAFEEGLRVRDELLGKSYRQGQP